MALGLAVLLFLLDGVVRPPAHPDRADLLQTYHEFAGRSGISTTPLSETQVQNLALLGKVWGLAKYHHPRVTTGQLEWDYELFRVMPGILAASTYAEAAEHLVSWLSALGELRPCSSACATLSSDLPLAPDSAWIHDVETLGHELSSLLARIRQNRPANGRQHYVSQQPGVGNPQFANELSYAAQAAPDAGYRLLSLFRFWNIIQYWFPYRDLLDESWHRVLDEFVPRLMAAEGQDAYRLEMAQLIGRIPDGHAAGSRNPVPRPPAGPTQLPIRVRFLEDRAVVAGYTHAELGPATGLSVGDVILRLDGSPVDSLLAAWRPFYAASNEAARLRELGRLLTRGSSGPVRITGERAGENFDFTAARVPLTSLDLGAVRTHDRPGETFQRLSDEVAYLKLSTIQRSDVAGYIRQAEGARVLVIDIRNYPSEFVVFELGGRLVTERTPFARITYGDLSNPGAFRWTNPIALTPLVPGFTGSVVILVDEITQSSAEYTAMALRASPNAIVVGSTTAGADGNVSTFPLPGGISVMISGIGVFYPDGSPTQRVGILPDLEVRPSIAGIRAGRDEVLEAAVSHALGRPFRAP